MTDPGHVIRVLGQAGALKYNLELHKGPNDLYLRLLNTKRKQVRPQTVESVEKLRELLLDPEDPANLEKYGATEAYDIRDLKSLTHLKFDRDTDVTFWDTSHVTDMSYMAHALHVKLTGIEHWNTSRVTNMEGAFSHAGFNQDIGRWDTTRVTNMRYMFGRDLTRTSVDGAPAPCGA
jgi:surface protein